MGKWSEKAGEVLEGAREVKEWLHKGHTAADVIHYAHTAYEAGKDAKESLEFYKGLSAVEKAKEVYAAGKEALGEAKSGPAGKGLDAAGKVLAIGETLIDYGQAAKTLYDKGLDKGAHDAGKQISTGVVGLAIVGTGPVGWVADKAMTYGMQAYAKHDLGRPLTDQEKKDITFKNMAAEGLNTALEKAGNALGDGTYKAVEWTKENVPKAAHAVATEAKAVAHKVADKAVEVKDAVVEKAADIKKDVVAVADKAVDKVEKAMEKVVPPEIAAKAMGDVDKAMAEPSTMGKLKGLWHAGHDAAKSVAQAHGI